VALDEPGIGSTDPNILIDTNCTHDELQFGMPGGRHDYDDEGDEIDKRDAIPTASCGWRAAIELEMIELETSDVDRYEGDDGDNTDVDVEEDAPQADDGSTQILEDCGDCTTD